MLEDRHIRKLVDYPAAGGSISGVEVKGGVCYFLWEREVKATVQLLRYADDDVVDPLTGTWGSTMYSSAIVKPLAFCARSKARNEPSITEILSVDKEFGWTSNFDGFHEKERSGDVPLFYIRKMKRGVGYIARKTVTKSGHLIDTWKVLVPEAFNGGDGLPHQIMGKPLIVPSPSVCTQSFLFFHVGSRNAAKSIRSYYTTRFFRFLVSLRKITQHATRSTYTWVPQQAWDRTWTDEILYKKYGMTKNDIAFIESRVRTMDGGDE